MGNKKTHGREEIQKELTVRERERERERERVGE